MNHRLRITGAALTASLLLLCTSSPGIADDEVGVVIGPDDVITQWTSSADQDSSLVDGLQTTSTTEAAVECTGHFSDVIRINNNIQYGGWTQCSAPEDLALTIAIYRYRATDRTWVFVTSVYNQRFGYLVNAVEEIPCNPTSKSQFYRLRTFPLVNGVQMVGYGKWSDNSPAIQCKA